MFTGLVEETGTVLGLENLRFRVRTNLVPREGDSVAVNGCCLTAVEIAGGMLSFDLLGETLRRTNLGELGPGSPVNLERALTADGRLGGHFVQGHIDGTSEVLSFERRGNDYRLEIALPAEFAELVVEKGSICLDGISLTIAEVNAASFAVWIIPHTLAVTNLRERKAGERVNVEYDLLAKHVARIVQVRKG
jgi:riboflavin synthase